MPDLKTGNKGLFTKLIQTRECWSRPNNSSKGWQSFCRFIAACAPRKLDNLLPNLLGLEHVHWKYVWFFFPQVGCPPPQIHAKPALAVQKLENIHICLEYLARNDVAIQGVTAEGKALHGMGYNNALLFINCYSYRSCFSHRRRL